MQSALHFVGFTDPMRYFRAVLVFGEPDIVHRYWDVRAVKEIAEGDVVVFANGNEHDQPREHAYDDSANTGDMDDVQQAEDEDEDTN